ncbi:MAG: helix-turn-helix domain-containing protein [Candidatus Pacearchaeota archaeon]|jgi:sugar-specific transcriptional regulator TrmB
MDTEILEELGLTKTEIKIYLTLLELGFSSAGKILVKSKLPNSTVHRDLNSLIEKGLISFILNGKRKIYSATNPENFFEFIEDKKRRFEEILPGLKEKQEKSVEKESASIYQGIKGIKEVYNIMINSKGKEYNTFGGGEIPVKIMGWTWWLNLHKRRIANRLFSRQIFDKTVKDIGREIEKNSLTKIRYVDEKFAQFQETVIVENYVAIAVFSENPYAFLIHDKNVADSYRKHFELLWESAR